MPFPGGVSEVVLSAYLRLAINKRPEKHLFTRSYDSTTRFAFQVDFLPIIGSFRAFFWAVFRDAQLIGADFALFPCIPFSGAPHPPLTRSPSSEGERSDSKAGGALAAWKQRNINVRCKTVIFSFLKCRSGGMGIYERAIPGHGARLLLF